MNMKHIITLTTAATACSAAALGQRPPICKCAPTESCWPSKSTWASLNSTVGGRLISTEPIAISCYPGPQQDAAECASIDERWTDPLYQATNPIGLSYPTDLTCPPINVTAGEKPGNCTLGTNPLFAINATKPSDVQAGVRFAKAHNVRLVIKDTGHDLLGLSFQQKYKSSCKASKWDGPAISVGGGYTFSDIYPLAQQHNVVVVGGGTPSVGALGGWMQGGGHGPASQHYGLGADQVISAQVVMADGSIVTANACQNQDIFFGIRGGGPGTYGVVLSTVIKAWPMVDVQVQHLAIAPLTSNTSALLDAVTIMFNAYPDLADAGIAGYGTWATASPTPLFANYTAGYVHGVYSFNKSLEATKEAFAPTLAKLSPYNMTSLFISVDYVSYADYWTFYHTESGVESAAGSEAAVGSRLFSRASVQNTTSLREMIGVVATSIVNSVELVSGGQVFKDGADVYSGLNPAWRKSYFNNIVAGGWLPGSSDAVKNAVRSDITNVKVGAMKKQAPDTGAYMNEADRLDPEWARDFYGAHYAPLLAIKNGRDPTGVFYCPTCVGSAAWAEDSTGKLCRVQLPGLMFSLAPSQL